jgi:hypothetical protein
LLAAIDNRWTRRMSQPLINPLSLYLDEELNRLQREWPALARAAPEPPMLCWTSLKEALLEFTETPAEELVVRGALSALVKQARFKSSDQVLREVLVLAASAADPQFRGRVASELEAPMP